MARIGVAARASMLVISMSAAAACSHTQAREADIPPVTFEEVADVDVVKVSHPEQFPVVPVTTRIVHSELQLPGVVAADVNRMVPVTSLAGGRVIDLRARLGDTVQKGQVLLTLRSPDVASARAELSKSLADAELAGKALERAKALSEHDALAAKDLEAAVNADQKAQADVRAAEERFRLLGSDVEQPSPTIEVRAPIAGVIVEQNVVGSGGVKSLDNSPGLFTIADLSHVWILCDVFENNLADVHVGDAATVRLNAYPDRVLQARISNLGRLLDPATRTAKVRLELSNPDGLLRVGMFATVNFMARESRTVSVVPSSAILHLHDKDWAFVPVDGQRFRRVAIQPGRDENGFQQVLGGLQAGDRVVAAALQLSSASEDRPQ